MYSSAVDLGLLSAENRSMTRATKLAIAVCLALIVAYIFVLPAFDISPTALRAAQHAAVLFISIAAAAYLLTTLKPPACRDLPLPDICYGSVSELIDLTCTRLC